MRSIEEQGLARQMLINDDNLAKCKQLEMQI